METTVVAVCAAAAVAKSGGIHPVVGNCAETAGNIASIVRLLGATAAVSICTCRGGADSMVISFSKTSCGLNNGGSVTRGGLFSVPCDISGGAVDVVAKIVVCLAGSP